MAKAATKTKTTKARKTGGTTSQTRKRPASTGADVRAWANEQGTWGTLGSRGRLNHEIVVAFNKAHPRRKYLPPAGL